MESCRKRQGLAAQHETGTTSECWLCSSLTARVVAKRPAGTFQSQLKVLRFWRHRSLLFIPAWSVPDPFSGLASAKSDFLNTVAHWIFQVSLSSSVTTSAGLPCKLGFSENTNISFKVFVVFTDTLYHSHHRLKAKGHVGVGETTSTAAAILCNFTRSVKFPA